MVNVFCTMVTICTLLRLIEWNKESALCFC